MLSVIIPAYNNPEKLKKLLESIAANRATCPVPFETIVVDDTSPADLDGVCRPFEEVRYIRLDGHPGPAAARNRGAAEARGSHLIFLDSDVIVQADTLKRFHDDFKAGVEAVAGEYDIEPAEDGFFARYKALLTESWMPKSRTVSVFALRAAGIEAGLFRRIGGFDEHIVTASVEDFEFGARIKRAGASIYYDPAITVRHHHPSFVRQMKLFYLRARDWIELFVARGWRFDDWCASPSEGVASIVGTFFVFSLLVVACARTAAATAFSAFLGILYLMLNRQFMKIVVRRRGFAFIPAAFAIKLALAVAITAGSCDGMVRSIWGMITKMRRGS